MGRRHDKGKGRGRKGRELTKGKRRRHPCARGSGVEVQWRASAEAGLVVGVAADPARWRQRKRRWRRQI
jgi:hypothetical protein